MCAVASIPMMSTVSDNLLSVQYLHRCQQDSVLIQANTISEVRNAIRSFRADGKTIALVPTMGALHDGHISLVDIARQHADVVVTSIFVNPLQFGPNEDLAKYPRSIEADIARLNESGSDIVFTPDVEEMYGRSPNTVFVESPDNDSMFEGAVRPGHFTGVLTVVAKLFHIVQPDFAVFGQKDLQQLGLIRRMVEELNFPIQIIGAPIIREVDGLAMSSRNRYLNSTDRTRATLLYKTLTTIKHLFASGVLDSNHLINSGLEMLAADANIKVDYLQIVDPISFTPQSHATNGMGVILAARVGATRLLDNIIL